MNNENTWIYESREVTEADVEGFFGFVYLITNLTNNRKYIGRKALTKAGRKTIKGKVKKIRLESDWKSYYGSSDELKKDIETLGHDKFSREILKFVKTRGELNYWETKIIVDAEAILRSSYYNGWFSAKIHSNHVKSLWIDDQPKICNEGDPNG